MRYFLMIILTLGVVGCREKTKRVEFTPGKSSRVDSPEAVEDSSETQKEEITITAPEIPESTKELKPRTRRKRPEGPWYIPPKKKEEVTPSPVKPTEKEIVDNTKDKKKVKDHIEKKIQKTAIYCMTRLEANPLQELNNSPYINVLYFKVENLSPLYFERVTRIELAKLKKSDLSSVGPIEVVSRGSTIISPLSEGRGLSLKFIADNDDFVASEMEFKIDKGDCIEDNCVNTKDYKSSFLNAEVASFLYLSEDSEYPTHYSDDRASCYFSKEAAKSFATELY